MRINKIILENFGPYIGENSFDIGTNEDQNIILIGGKNGAGKTTLFLAIRLCLYGYLCLGYKNSNAYYAKAVTKYINNQAKLIHPTTARVAMNISISDGSEMDHYTITRKWIIADSFCEKLEVEKNSILLEEGERDDFEKYLFQLIPPDLFDLFFFDGESITGFFLDDGNKQRVKNAFLTLCGYDTFQLMESNFHRLASKKSGKKTISSDYFAAKAELETAELEIEKIRKEMENVKGEIISCDGELLHIDSEYKKSGGVSQSKWEQLIADIKIEEKRRNTYNNWLKNIANDVVPFLVVRPLLEEVLTQIESEQISNKYNGFIEVLRESRIRDVIKKYVDGDYQALIQNLEKEISKTASNDNSKIFDLSFRDSAAVISQIDQILSFDPEKIVKVKNAIKESIKKTVSARNEMEKSNVSLLTDYLHKKELLYKSKESLLLQQMELEKQVIAAEKNLENIQSNYKKYKDAFEIELRQKSIYDISEKAILMLDELQPILYHRQIEKVENIFRNTVQTLFRKTNFIDDISIDDDFTIHIYHKQSFSIQNLREIISDEDEKNKTTVLASAIKRTYGKDDISILFERMGEKDDNIITLLLEIDKDQLSNGEKQIFIMALYYSLVTLSTHEIPFIIDTPFARIDKEHRKNITKYFFKNLRGQIFILSTNEEITEEHVEILQDQIAAKFTIMNEENDRTIILSDKYF